MNKIPLQAVPPTPETEQSTTTTTTPLDPFDPANLRLTQSFTETVAVKKLLLTIPVRKPGSQEFVRVHPSPEFRENFPIIELKDEKEEYIVAAGLVPELVGEFVTKTLFLAINRQGTLFFWPVRLPGPDGKDNPWWKSAREAAHLAMEHWVRIKANMNLGANEVSKALEYCDVPGWPEDMGYWDLIKISRRDYLINAIDHLVIKQLRGKV